MTFFKEGAVSRKRGAAPQQQFPGRAALRHPHSAGKAGLIGLTKSIVPTKLDDLDALWGSGNADVHGLRQVELAKADGRWDRAYASGKDMVLPEDLLAALEAEPKAKEALAKLNAQNRYAIAFRLHNMKTEAGRKRKIASFVHMLKSGEMIYPQTLK